MNFTPVLLEIGDPVIHQSPFKELDKIGRNKSHRANGGRPRYGRVFNKYIDVPEPYFKSKHARTRGRLTSTVIAEWHYSIKFEDGTTYECSQYIADRFLRVGTRKKSARKG